MKLYLLSVRGASTPTGSSAAAEPAARSLVETITSRQQPYHYALQAAKLFMFSLLLSMSCLLSASAQSTGALVGSSTAVTASQTVDLTSLGTSDWAHWGLNGIHAQTPGQFDHKIASGTMPVGLISNYATVGTGKVVSFPNCLVNCSWTGGSQTGSAITSSEVYMKSNGSGFRLTVPADTTSRTLTLYVGGYDDNAKLTAHLSDGSAADFTDTSYGYNKPGSTDGHHYQAAFTLTYHAAAAGQTLTVSWVQISALTSAQSGIVGNVTLQGAALALNASVIASPMGLTATPQWVTSCPVCNGMAMAHIVLAWNAVAGATSYTVYRDGTPVQTGLTAPAWTDMTVVSGTTYTYTVTATGSGAESQPSASATASAPTDPSAPSGTVVTAPVNLCVSGLWQTGPTDLLTWSPVPGAVSYNLYQYGTLIASHVPATSYTVPVNLWSGGLTYIVTAVDAMGMETLPSAPATAAGGNAPTQQPGWVPNAPPVPTNLLAIAEWNGGAPRIHLKWQGDGNSDYCYAVYRDGSKVASGLWGLNYFDVTVKPGETHTYAVTGLNLPWTTLVESARSQSTTATALKAAPASAAAPVQITGVTPDDDSAVVSFAAVPGAVDYRVYSTAKPNTVKYSGGGLSIEMNGLDPVNGADLVVEAVDKLGPFQTMDGMAGPGAMQMDGEHSAINGQGDPSDLPNVLAASLPVHVTLTPVTLTGSQVFFDNFRSEPALVNDPMPVRGGGGFYGEPGEYSQVSNDKWTIADYGGDITDSKVFFMGNHFMDTLYDGGQPHIGDPMHNNNASLVLLPKRTADISGGKVLHVTMEVDAHFDSRRWCDIDIIPAGDVLLNPGKIPDGDFICTSGNVFQWQIESQFHVPNLFLDNVPTQLVNVSNGINSDGANVERDVVWHSGPANTAWTTVGTEGTVQDLDKRHKFDLYLSQTHYRIMESGQVIKDADFPGGQRLPFSQCQVCFVHEVYHTGNDRPEQVTYSTDNYWPSYRPWADERHWDNMGEEVLTAFPN